MKQIFICVVAAFAVALIVNRAEAAETWISCTPFEIATYPNRVHVRCAAAVGGVSFFAAGTQDTAYAARVLSVITAAQVAGRTLNVLYDPADQTGTAIGCQVADCRLSRAVGFGR